MYLSPDSISRTRRIGSSERREARTQPAVPTGHFSRFGTGEDKGKLTPSYNDDVVLELKQSFASDTVSVNLRREVPEIIKKERFLRGSFCCLEDEKNRDDSNEGEVGVLREGRGHGCLRVSGFVLRLCFRATYTRSYDLGSEFVVPPSSPCAHANFRYFPCLFDLVSDYIPRVVQYSNTIFIPNFDDFSWDLNKM